MERWEIELNCSFQADQWLVMIDNLRKSNRAAAFRETPLKIFTRWYMTPAKIHSFYPNVSPNCFRGCQEVGNYFHIFWDCKLLQPIWLAVVERLEITLKKKIPLTPYICLLFATVPDVPSPCNRMIHSLISAVQWMIACNWKSQNLPWPQVISRMESIKLSERIHHTLYDSMHIFSNKWLYWPTPP